MVGVVGIVVEYLLQASTDERPQTELHLNLGLAGDKDELLYPINQISAYAMVQYGTAQCGTLQYISQQLAVQTRSLTHSALVRTF